jgi:hypothetical protein
MSQDPRIIPIIETCNYGTVFSENDYHDIKTQLGDNLLDYKITKIKCQLKSNTNIQGIQFFYKNINTGEEKALIDIKKNDGELIEQEMILNNEDIIDLKVFLKDVILVGFEVTTNKKRSKKFGYGGDEDLINIPDLENLDKIIVGFGVCSSDDGISSIYCYYSSKRDYVFHLYTGLLSLRIKLKDSNFKEKTDKKLPKMNDKNKLLYRICSLPDNLYFNIIKYAL